MISEINGTTAGDMSSEDLDNVTASVLATVQLGNISDVLNSSVVGVSVSEPLPDPSSQEWSVAVNNSDDDPYTVVVVVDRMEFYEAPDPLHEGVPLQTQPVIRVLDAFVSIVF